MIKSVLGLALAVVGLSSIREAVAADQVVRLVPHRAVYDLSLVSSRGMRGIEGASGRIAFEFTGNGCEGYALKFRQVTILQSAETGLRTSDLRTASFESGDGKNYRFRNDSVSRQGAKTVDGVAERRPGSPLAVKLNAPRRQNLSLNGEAVFPQAQMRDIIAAARERKTLLEMKVFDGADDGRKVHDTLAVIGGEIKPGGNEPGEAPARQDKLAKLSRWPVVLSYFAPGRQDRVPSYTLSFEVYDNGISRALKLDYGDFALRGDLVRLDLLPEKGDCQR